MCCPADRCSPQGEARRPRSFHIPGGRRPDHASRGFVVDRTTVRIADPRTDSFPGFKLDAPHGATFAAHRKRANINWFENGVTLAILVLTAVSSESSIGTCCGWALSGLTSFDVPRHVPYGSPPL